MELTPSELAKINVLDSLITLEDTVSYVRRALAASFERSAKESLRGEAEQYAVQALSFLLDAHDALVAAAEAEL